MTLLIRKPLWGSLYVIKFPDWNPPQPPVLKEEWITFWNEFFSQIISKSCNCDIYAQLIIPGITSYSPVLNSFQDVRIPYVAIWRVKYPGEYCDNSLKFFIEKFESISFSEYLDWTYDENKDYISFEYHTKRLIQEFHRNEIELGTIGMWIPEYLSLGFHQASHDEPENIEEESQPNFDWGYGDTTEELYQKTADVFETVSISKDFGEVERLEQRELNSDDEPDEDPGLLQMNQSHNFFQQALKDN